MDDRDCPWKPEGHSEALEVVARSNPLAESSREARFWSKPKTLGFGAKKIEFLEHNLER